MYGWTGRWKQVIGPTVSVAVALVVAGTVPAGPALPVAEPPGCWGPHGVDPDCLGPGPYGHGEWGPDSATVAPGAMIVPGGPAESDLTVP